MISRDAPKEQYRRELMDRTLVVVDTFTVTGIGIGKEQLEWRRYARLESFWKVGGQSMYQKGYRINVSIGVFHAFKVLGLFVCQSKYLKLGSIKDEQLGDKLAEMRCCSNDGGLIVVCNDGFVVVVGATTKTALLLQRSK